MSELIVQAEAMAVQFERVAALTRNHDPGTTTIDLPGFDTIQSVIDNWMAMCITDEERAAVQRTSKALAEIKAHLGSDMRQSSVWLHPRLWLGALLVRGAKRIGPRR